MDNKKRKQESLVFVGKAEWTILIAYQKQTHSICWKHPYLNEKFSLLFYRDKKRPCPFLITDRKGKQNICEDLNALIESLEVFNQVKKRW